MSVSQIDPTAPSGNISWNNLNEWANLNAFGRDRISLTEWDTSIIPQVAAGSLLESGGALYQVDTDTSIGGSPTDGDVYIIFNPSTLTFDFTNTAPTWSAANYGYYDVATGYKVLMFTMLKSGSNYDYKRAYDPQSRFNTNVAGEEFYVRQTSNFTPSTSFAPVLGVWTVDSNLGNFNAATGIFTAPSNGIYEFSASLLSSTTSASSELYVCLVKNSTVINWFRNWMRGESVNENINFSSSIYLDASDTVGIYAQHDVTGSLLVPSNGITIGGLTMQSTFCGTKII